MELDHRGHMVCDVTLIAEDDGTKVEANKSKLASESDYFKVIFFSPHFREAEARVVRFYGIDGYSLQFIVDYINGFPRPLQENGLLDILKAANMYIITGLEQSCTDCIITTYMSDSIEWLKFVCKNDVYINLYERVISSIKTFYQKLPLEILVSPQSFVMQKCTKFAKMNSGKGLSSKLHRTLTEKFEIFELICNNGNCEVFLQMLDTPYWYIRKAQPVRNFYAIRIQDQGTLDAQRYDGSTWFPSMRFRLPEMREHFGIAIKDKCLFIVGGMLASGKPTDRVDFYSFTKMKWKRFYSLNQSRFGCTVTVVDGVLYVVGGSNGGGDLRSVEKFDPETKKWHYVANMSIPNYSPFVLGVRGLLCVSKPTAHGSSTRISIYNTATKLWTEISITIGDEILGLVSQRFLCTMIVICRSLVIKYSFDDNSKQIIPIKQIHRKYTKCTYVDGSIIVYGKKKIQEYDETRMGNEWKTLPDFENANGDIILCTDL